MKTRPMFFGSLALASVLYGNAGVQATLTPTETIKETVGTVMGILNDPTYEQPGMSHARRAALETVIRNSVSYREMARRSLGVTWMVLADSEQERFSDLFLQVLRDGVASRMSRYSDTRVMYLGERREGNFAEVRTLFRGDKEDTAIDLRLVNQSGRWLMYDAVIDGVGLVDNYRSQFLHVIKEMAYVGLVSKIEAMTLLSKTFERTNVP
jgi:phospholipid transport system substrate-binding protein